MSDAEIRGFEQGVIFAASTACRCDAVDLAKEVLGAQGITRARAVELGTEDFDLKPIDHAEAWAE